VAVSWRHHAVLLIALGCAHCSSAQRMTEARSGAARIAHSMAITANGVWPILRQAYITEGLGCVSGSADADTAQRCIDRVKLEWEPVWESWDLAADGLEAWGRVLNEASGEAETLRAAMVARSRYCTLRAWAEHKVDLPPWPGGCEGHEL